MILRTFYPIKLTSDELLPVCRVEIYKEWTDEAEYQETDSRQDYIRQGRKWVKSDLSKILLPEWFLKT